MGFLHKTYIFLKNLRMVEPLVWIIVTTVEKMGETRGWIHIGASIFLSAMAVFQRRLHQEYFIAKRKVCQ